MRRWLAFLAVALSGFFATGPAFGMNSAELNGVISSYDLGANAYNWGGHPMSESTTQDTGSHTASSIYNGDDLIYEVTHTGTYSGTSNIVSETRYMWGLDASQTQGGAGGIGGLVLAETRAGGSGAWTSYFPIYDPQHNIVGLASDAGNQTEWLEYDPYGNVLRYTGPPANQCNFGYMTKYTDPDTGLVNFGHRWYDPATDRWLSREPLGEGASVNLYEFANNDPINHSDYLGLMTIKQYRDDIMQLTAQMYAATNGLSSVVRGVIVHSSEYDRIIAPFKAKIAADNAAIGRIHQAARDIEQAAGVRYFDPQTLDDSDDDFKLRHWLNFALRWNPGSESAADILDGNYRAAANDFSKAVVLTVAGNEAGGFLGGQLAELPLPKLPRVLPKLPKALPTIKLADIAAESRIGATGKVGEQWLANNLGGESQVYFKTSQGGRFIDQLVGDVAHESKVGYTTLTPTIQTQILKDAELINSGAIKGSTWHFFESPVTGQGGASAPLQEFLQQNGINTVNH